MSTQQTTTETNTPITEVIDVPCKDCTDNAIATFDLKNFADWSDHDLLAAILVELIMIRTNFTNISEGLESLQGSGIGKMLGGLFGG